VTSIRVVLTPEAVVVAEARRTLTALSLYGYRVDGVVANRVFPPITTGADAEAGVARWHAGWVEAQRAQLEVVAASFPGLPVWRSEYAAAEPVGVEALGLLASAMYADADPLAVLATPEPLTVERVSSDEYVLSVALPHAQRHEIELARKGDDLVLTVGSFRRVIALPSVLRRCLVDGAGLRDGRLRVRFRPDPDLWMTP
jgi:arsenite-transporting ATPase